MIPDEFVCGNVIDSCALINLVSSPILLRTSRDRCNHYYIATLTVLYECLVKSKVGKQSTARVESRRRIERCLEKKDISRMDITIDDLQMVSRQEMPKRLGRGELSCAAAAIKIGKTVALMTDNRKDWNSIQKLLPQDQSIQTTPRLLGWMVFREYFGDADINDILKQHNEMDGDLSPHFQNAFKEGMAKRLIKIFSH